MSATRDEVLRAMARALCSGYGLCPTCESTGQCVGDMNEGAFLDEAKRALAAAEQAGWRLVPVEPTEEMIEDLAIKLYEERARNRGLPMAKWENAPEMVRSLERRDAAAAYRLALAAAPKVTP